MEIKKKTKSEDKSRGTVENFKLSQQTGISILDINGIKQALSK